MANKFHEKLDQALNDLDISHHVRESHLGEGLPHPNEVLSLIKSTNVPFVMIGAHGIFQYTGKPRGTIDIDFIIGGSMKRIIDAIHETWPKLKIARNPYKTSFMVGQHEVIDLVKPTQPIFKLALNNKNGDIPSLEMALVLKYAAAISPNREKHDKRQDTVDFIRIVEKNDVNTNEVMRLTQAAQLYDGASKEILKLIKDIKLGKEITI